MVTTSELKMYHTPSAKDVASWISSDDFWNCSWGLSDAGDACIQTCLLSIVDSWLWSVWNSDMLISWKVFPQKTTMKHSVYVKVSDNAVSTSDSWNDGVHQGNKNRLEDHKTRMQDCTRPSSFLHFVMGFELRAWSAGTGIPWPEGMQTETP